MSDLKYSIKQSKDQLASPSKRFQRNPLARAIALALMGGWTLPTTSFAVPAIPTTQTLAQPSGVTFPAKQWGNELVNGWETENGYTVILDNRTGNWTLARLDPTGRLISSTVVIGQTATPSSYPKHVRPRGSALENALNVANQVPISSAKLLATKGTVNLPILLVNFTDTTTTYTSQDVNASLFGEGQSAKAYLAEVSRNTLDVSPGVAGVSGWYTASSIHDYYGLERGYSRAGDLVKETIQAAEKEGFNFANYDNDGDCFVDSVVVIHQGNGAEAGGNTKNIWSHYGRIPTYTTGSTAECGSIKVSNYIVSPETLFGSSSTIGAFVHEVGHAMGLIEPTDVAIDASKGVGVWDTMSVGAWNGVQSPGDSPAHFAAPTKAYLKWVEPVLVDKSKIGEVVEQAATQGKIYQLSANGKTLLVENRQRVGFDAGLPGSGIALWNVVDSTSNKIEVVQADATISPTINDATDLFSSDAGTTSFIDTTANIGITAVSKSQEAMVANLCTDATPEMTITPLSLELGPRDQKTFTISSTGCGSLQVNSLSVGGQNATEFTVKEDNCSNRTISAGQSCTVKVARSFTGDYWLAPNSKATLSVASNVPSASSVDVALKANGCYQYLATYSWPQYYPFWNSSIDFGTELVGDSNTLGQSLWTRTWGNRLDCDVAPAIKEVTLSGDSATDFTLKNVWGQQCYHAKNSYTYKWNGKDYPYSYSYSYCWFNNKFAPTSEGVKNAGLNVAFNSPHINAAVVPLKAKAVTEGAASIQVSPDSATFKDTFAQSRSAYQIFGLKNVGEVNLKWSSLLTEISGTDASDFMFFKWWYSPVVIPSQQASLYSQFAPKSLGQKNANLVVKYQTNTREGDRGQDLSGNGTQPVDCSEENITIETSDTFCHDASWSSSLAKTNIFDQPNTCLWKRKQGDTRPLRPFPDDVVRIKTTVYAIPDAKVKALCIAQGGELIRSPNQYDPVRTLRIYATDYIENKGVIRTTGKEDDPLFYSEQSAENCNSSSKVGTGFCAKSGTTIYLQAGDPSLWWTNGRPLINEGEIIAGSGGDGSSYAAKGGDVYILATGFTNVTPTGKITAGNGGNLTTLKTSSAGNGGMIYINGNFSNGGYLTTQPLSQLNAGNGGNCDANYRLPIGEISLGGYGGNLTLLGRTSLTFKGIHKPGLAGENCGGRGGIIGDPVVLSLGTTTQIDSGDVEIYGGDEWVLDLSNLNKTVINATGNVTFAVGENAVVDLRGNNTPIVNTTGELRIFSDSIMLDEGVMLEDIFKAANIVIGPHKIIHKVVILGSGNNFGEPGTTVPVNVTIANAGPTKDTYLLKVTDTEGWEMTALPETIEVEGLQTIEIAMDVKLPATRGMTDAITVTANLRDDPQVESSATVYASVVEEKKVISINTYSASGKVFAEVKPLPMPLANVSIQVGDNITTTDATGTWQIEGLTDGNYTVTASRDGYTIAPQDFTVKGGDVTLTLEVVPVGDRTAHGTLRDDQGNPIAGVTIDIDGKTTTTDALGNWQINGLVDETTYIVTASKDGYTFAPTTVDIGNETMMTEVNIEPLTTLKLTAKPSTWGPIGQGENLTYTFTLTNGGQHTATGITLTEQLPKGATLVSMTAAEGTCDLSKLICTLPDLAPGSNTTVSLTFKASEGGNLKNVATLNSAEYPVDVQTSWKMVKPYLSVTITDSPDPVQMLKNLHYTLNVELSPVAPVPTATGIKVVTQLPKGVELQQLSTDQGSCRSDQHSIITCELDELSVASPEKTSQARVEMDLQLKDAGLLMLTMESKISSNEYPSSTTRERSSIFVPPDFKVDMAIVIDTTGSMQGEINGLFNAAKKFLQAQVSSEETPTIALIDFKDDVKVLALSKDHDVILNAIKGMKAEGGGLCPEASAEAIEIALNHVKEGGSILLATDASPYDDADIESLLSRLQAQKIRFDAIISGDCTDKKSWN